MKDKQTSKVSGPKVDRIQQDYLPHNKARDNNGYMAQLQQYAAIGSLVLSLGLYVTSLMDMYHKQPKEKTPIAYTGQHSNGANDATQLYRGQHQASQLPYTTGNSIDRLV